MSAASVTATARAPFAAAAGARTRLASRASAFVAPARAFLANSARPAVAAASACAGMTTSASAAAASSIYEFTVKNIDGTDIKFDRFKGKVLLIVNVASQCGFTPQYKDLVALQQKYGAKGLEVLAFPCNQFGGQEPGSNAEVKAFAQRQGATFPLFAKTDVNGPGESPLWAFLKKQQGGLMGSDIKWNFTKFLVDKSGNVVGRYAPTTNPQAIESDIAKLL